MEPFWDWIDDYRVLSKSYSKSYRIIPKKVLEPLWEWIDYYRLEYGLDYNIGQAIVCNVA